MSRIHENLMESGKLRASASIREQLEQLRSKVSLLKKDGSIELVIEDNGVAFTKQDDYRIEHADTGFGLAGMKERTELSGGVFEIRSAEGKGTFIRALWPCPYE